MSFRAALFLSIAIAVISSAFIEAGLDFLADRASAFAESRIDSDLERFGDAVEAQLVAALDSPALPGHLVVETPLSRRAHYMVFHNDALLFDSSPTASEEQLMRWRTQVRYLRDGYRVELAVAPLIFEGFLTSSLLTDVIDLPLFVVLSLVAAWLLARIVMRPVRELTEASQKLTAKQFPEPITVPTGNDELSRMARSFNAMTTQVHGFIERERTFTRYASHELRTPLSALKAQLESVRIGLAAPTEVWPALERNVQRMEDLLAALLILARSTEYESEGGELLPLLEDVVAGLPVECRERVVLRPQGAKLPLVTDRRLAGQAVRNLLENALRYSDGRVILDATLAGHEVKIAVRDEGAGVAETALERLREPFFRATEAAHGLGLGLSLVDSIARSLGGRLELRNTEPGFEAAVTLPVPIAGEGG